MASEGVVKLPSDVAAPLEWHPYYRNRTYLLDWLDGGQPPYDTIVVPIVQRIRFTQIAPTAMTTSEPDFHRLTLTKYRAWGRAPFVGRPFAYVWNVGIDQYGRQIAGDARIQYTDGSLAPLECG